MNQTPTLSFIDAIKKVFANYANFNGRARRSEFWWFYLFICIVNAIFSIPLQSLVAKKQALVDEGLNIALQGGDYSSVAAQDPTTTIWIILIVWAVVLLALLIPNLAVMARRLHDVGKSGHMMWLFLLCGVGGLIPLIMCIPDGNPAPNQYGESPKYTN